MTASCASHPGCRRDLTRLAFRLCFRGRRLTVEVNQRHATYTLATGEPLELTHHGRSLTVGTGDPVTLAVPAAPKRERPPQPRGREPRPRKGQAS